jgi:Asp-tRNA(Asn)/Glu-tRNA(Gln) amidotransferase A subunit family amidase
MAFIPEVGRFKRLHQDLAYLVKKYPDPQSRPDLFGIPVAIKDLYHVSGFLTRAGSKLPPEILTAGEGEVIKKLKLSGALILGKTVSAEFAYFAPGPTRNPHNINHTPGGSSSGSAAAVAAGLTPLAFGTQTIGSIIRPAAYCGVVGFKPSQGRIPTDGIVPLSPSVDHVGFFTSDVESVNTVASLVCQNWNNTIKIHNIKLAIPLGPYVLNVNSEVLKHFEKVCGKLSDCGYEIVQIPMMNNFDEIVERHNSLVAAEAAIVHKDWFKENKNLYHPKTAELLVRGQKIDHLQLQKYRLSCLEFRNEIMELIEKNNISAILSPSTVDSAPIGLDSTGNPIMNLPWTQAGLPVINIPTGNSNEGLPLGLQIVGKYGADEELLETAKEIEKCV